MTDPADEKVHDSVEVPAPVTLVGVRVHAALSAESVTWPLKPLTAATVMVDIPAWLTFTLTLVGLALIVKSWTVKETVAVCERLPLVPVTVTVTLPVEEKVHDSIEVPEPPVTVAGVRLHATLSLVRETVPVKPFNGEIVTVDVPAELTLTFTDVGFVEMVKSGAGVTVYATVVVWLREPLPPVTVTVTEPVEAKVHESVEVPEPPETEVGVRVQPALSLARATVPVKPFSGAMVMVEVPAVLTTTLTAVGFAEIVKSGAGVTVKSTLVEWVREPLVPVIVTVTDPVDVKVHERVEVPEPPVTVAGVREHAALSLVKATLPVNPFDGEMVIVEVPGEPTNTDTVGGLAAMEKSGTAAPMIVTDIGAVELVMRLFVPPVPVIVTENVVVEATVPVNVHVVVAVPPAVRVTGAGLHEAVTPDGEEVEPIVTDPANWKVAAPRLVAVTPT